MFCFLNELLFVNFAAPAGLSTYINKSLPGCDLSKPNHFSIGLFWHNFNCLGRVELEPEVLPPLKP